MVLDYNYVTLFLNQKLREHKRSRCDADAVHAEAIDTAAKRAGVIRAIANLLAAPSSKAALKHKRLQAQACLDKRCRGNFLLASHVRVPSQTCSRL